MNGYKSPVHILNGYRSMLIINICNMIVEQGGFLKKHKTLIANKLIYAILVMAQWKSTGSFNGKTIYGNKYANYAARQ